MRRLVAILFLLIAVSAEALTPTPTNTPTPSHTPTFTTTATAIPTVVTRTRTATKTVTSTPTKTRTRTITKTVTKTPTLFPTPSVTITNTVVVDNATPTVTPTFTLTPTPTVTFTGTPLAAARIPMEMIKWSTPQVPTPAAMPLCAWISFNDNLIPKCIPIGSGSIGGTQRESATTGSLAAGVAAQVCITWDTAYADGNAYSVNAWVEDSPANLAAIRVDHVVSGYGGASACAIVFNQDATNARTGTLWMEAFPR